MKAERSAPTDDENAKGMGARKYSLMMMHEEAMQEAAAHAKPVLDVLARRSFAVYAD